MNLSYLSFYSQYLNSPKTILHKISSKNKILIIYNLLIIIPYLNNIKLIIYTTLLIYIINYIINKISLNKNKLIQFFLFFLFLIYYLSKYKDLKFYKLKEKKYIKKFFQKYFYIVPKFLLITINITLIYFKLINILFISTKYETILRHFLYLFKIIAFKYLSWFLLNLSLTSQFLEKSIQNFKIIYISVKIRYRNNFIVYNLYLIFYQLINNYIFDLFQETFDISSHLWNNKISLKHIF
uniref:Uncharacterized protein n=1 Tax=Dictyurus purpurascens TaxID=189649 RepID=A0A4D6WRU9_9FLOR|nr:hypothetical protein [Dictyurus purpurascens]